MVSKVSTAGEESKLFLFLNKHSSLASVNMVNFSFLIYINIQTSQLSHFYTVGHTRNLLPDLLPIISISIRLALLLANTTTQPTRPLHLHRCYGVF